MLCSFEKLLKKGRVHVGSFKEKIRGRGGGGVGKVWGFNFFFLWGGGKKRGGGGGGGGGFFFFCFFFFLGGGGGGGGQQS